VVLRRRLSVLATAIALSGGVAAVPAATPTIAVAKSCSVGYTHAVMPDGSHKCLHVGEFCRRAWDRAYRRYRFHCHRRDANGRFHLTR
jgi:hypothetical protein